MRRRLGDRDSNPNYMIHHLPLCPTGTVCAQPIAVKPVEGQYVATLPRPCPRQYLAKVHRAPNRPSTALRRRRRPLAHPPAQRPAPQPDQKPAISGKLAPKSVVTVSDTGITLDPANDVIVPDVSLFGDKEMIHITNSAYADNNGYWWIKKIASIHNQRLETFGGGLTSEFNNPAHPGR